jgi:ZIP family zinc transporter
MNQATTVLLGAIAGGTIFLGLPVARLRGLPRSVQGFLNAFATGILVFLLWDILSHAGEPVEAAIAHGNSSSFAGMAVIFAGGVTAGLLGLVYFNRSIFSHLRHGTDAPNRAGTSQPVGGPRDRRIRPRRRHRLHRCPGGRIRAAQHH